jgi:hypothetical protein
VRGCWMGSSSSSSSSSMQWLNPPQTEQAVVQADCREPAKIARRRRLAAVLLVRAIPDRRRTKVPQESASTRALFEPVVSRGQCLPVGRALRRAQGHNLRRPVR